MTFLSRHFFRTVAQVVADERIPIPRSVPIHVDPREQQLRLPAPRPFRSLACTSGIVGREVWQGAGTRVIDRDPVEKLFTDEFRGESACSGTKPDILRACERGGGRRLYRQMVYQSKNCKLESVDLALPSRNVTGGTLCAK